MSTVKFSCMPSGLVIMISGLSYWLTSVEGMPISCTIALEVSELILESVAPMLYSISVGGGVKNRRKIIGKNVSRRV